MIFFLGESYQQKCASLLLTSAAIARLVTVVYHPDGVDLALASPRPVVAVLLVLVHVHTRVYSYWQIKNKC